MDHVVLSEVEYRFFNRRFAVSRDGKVLRNLTPITPYVRNDGYAKLCGTLLHRIVALLWVDRVEGANLVHHKDGDKSNNCASNLEWVTPREHVADKHHGVHGKYIRTEKTRQKLRDFRTGFKDAPEVAARKREILDAVCPKRECTVDGITYRSVRQASISLGIHVCTVRQRCLSKNFPNYKIGEKTTG